MFEIRDLKFKEILDIPELRIGTQVACILGPSGSGKTTLLKLLNRLYHPDSGQIFLNGEELRELDPVALRRRVVMLGQNPVLYPGGIRENLQIGLELSGRPLADETAIKSVLQRVGLAHAPDNGCSTLSGGERQRLCLARVMLMDAECYLLDEPSSALDRETERFVIENLSDFTTAHGKQLVMVTHSENVARMFPQGLIRMEAGRVKEVGL